MHSAGSYLQAISKTAVHSVLTDEQRNVLGIRLKEDAKDYYHSALITFVDATTSLSRGYFSWTTVKMYYAVFYALRARLALAGECITYVDKSPRLVATDAASIVSCPKEASTHKLVIKRFSTTFQFDVFISQEIGSENPLTWLTKKREEANYNISRFSEPTAPSHLSFASTTELRQLLNSYLADDLYTHNEEHSIVAFPFKLLIDLRARLSKQGLNPLSSNEIDFVKNQMKDQAGFITPMAKLLLP